MKLIRITCRDGLSLELYGYKWKDKDDASVFYAISKKYPDIIFYIKFHPISPVVDWKPKAGNKKDYYIRLIMKDPEKLKNIKIEQDYIQSKAKEIQKKFFENMSNKGE